MRNIYLFFLYICVFVVYTYKSWKRGQNYLKKKYFIYNDRLGIHIPDLDLHWEKYDSHIQQEILTEWEDIRGTIPDRIRDLEAIINKKQQQLNEEECFSTSCTLNYEIAELASQINDLWLWYRTQEDITEKSHD